MDPGSAAHRFALRSIRGTHSSSPRNGFAVIAGGASRGDASRRMKPQISSFLSKSKIAPWLRFERPSKIHIDRIQN
jgi:hypothetical protein